LPWEWVESTKQYLPHRKGEKLKNKEMVEKLDDEVKVEVKR
jgi:hypothetical protein